MLRALLTVGCLALASSAVAQTMTPAPQASRGVVEQIVRQTMPAPGSALPPATALDGQAGASTDYARADHTHAARVQRVAMTTAADGTVTWTFARPIVVPTGKVPPMSFMVEDTGSPVVVQVISRTFTTAGGVDTHTAVTVKAQRSRTLPALIASLTPLLNYDVFGGAASGVRVNLWAADPTQ